MTNSPETVWRFARTRSSQHQCSLVQGTTFTLDKPSATKLNGPDNLRAPFLAKISAPRGFWLPVQRVVNHAPITSFVAKKPHCLAFASDAGGVWRLSLGHRCDRSRVQEAGGPAESGAKRGDPAATAAGPPTRPAASAGVRRSDQVTVGVAAMALLGKLTTPPALPQ